MTITIDGVDMFTTMRTPGNDIDLALGWLVNDGTIRRADDVVSARECRTIADTANPDMGQTERTAVEVELRTASRPRPRQGWTSSACGICGAEAIDDVLVRALPSRSTRQVTVASELLLTLPESLREQQQVFDRTGGLHAAGLFSLEGQAMCVREDVGRHNAVDKVIGWALAEHLLPLDQHILQLSGRASFELVQKAAMAGIPVVSAVSAPSSLAVELAERAGITLVGFVRGSTMNIYAGAERLT